MKLKKRIMNMLTILDSSGIIGLIGSLVYFVAIFAILYFTMGKTFEKAGHPAWSALVPIYNFYIWLKVIGKPTWWLILFFIPVVSIVAFVLIHIGIAKSFGKDTTFGILLAFIPFYNLYLWYTLGNKEEEKYYGPAGEGVEGFAEFKDMTAA